MEKFIEKYLSTMDAYKECKKIVQAIKSGNIKAEHIAFKCITQGVSGLENPTVFLNSLLKDLFNTNMKDIQEKIRTEFLMKIVKIAEFNKDCQNFTRGSQFFGENQDQNINILGNSLVRLSLECILVWAHQYKENNTENDFYLQYLQLKNDNICFPTVLVYFPKFKFPKMNIEDIPKEDLSQQKRKKDSIKNQKLFDRKKQLNNDSKQINIQQIDETKQQTYKQVNNFENLKKSQEIEKINESMIGDNEMIQNENQYLNMDIIQFQNWIENYIKELQILLKQIQQLIHTQNINDLQQTHFLNNIDQFTLFIQKLPLILEKLFQMNQDFQQKFMDDIIFLESLSNKIIDLYISMCKKTIDFSDFIKQLEKLIQNEKPLLIEDKMIQDQQHQQNQIFQQNQITNNQTNFINDEILCENKQSEQNVIDKTNQEQFSQNNQIVDQIEQKNQIQKEIKKQNYQRHHQSEGSNFIYCQQDNKQSQDKKLLLEISQQNDKEKYQQNIQLNSHLNSENQIINQMDIKNQDNHLQFQFNYNISNAKQFEQNLIQNQKSDIKVQQFIQNSKIPFQPINEENDFKPNLPKSTEHILQQSFQSVKDEGKINQFQQISIKHNLYNNITNRYSYQQPNISDAIKNQRHFSVPSSINQNQLMQYNLLEQDFKTLNYKQSDQEEDNPKPETNHQIIFNQINPEQNYYNNQGKYLSSLERIAIKIEKDEDLENFDKSSQSYTYQNSQQNINNSYQINSANKKNFEIKNQFKEIPLKSKQYDQGQQRSSFKNLTIQDEQKLKPQDQNIYSNVNQESQMNQQSVFNEKLEKKIQIDHTNEQNELLISILLENKKLIELNEQLKITMEQQQVEQLKLEQNNNKQFLQAKNDKKDFSITISKSQNNSPKIFESQVDSQFITPIKSKIPVFANSEIITNNDNQILQIKGTFNQENKCTFFNLALINEDKESLLINQIQILSNQNILRFKLACLQDKASFYKNDFLRIGVIKTALNNTNYKISVNFYFDSLKQNMIQNLLCKFDISKNGNQFKIDIIMKQTNEIFIDQICEFSQKNQEICFDFNQIPFKLVQLVGCYQQKFNPRIDNMPYIFQTLLPVTLLNFIEHKTADNQKLQQLIKKGFLFTTLSFELNCNIIKKNIDFQKFFPQLIDINSTQINEKYQFYMATLIKVQGSFNEYVLLIKINQNDLVKFQIICPFDQKEEEKVIIKHLLQTLIFLFKKN